MIRRVMFQGTGSDVGKTLFVAGLARAFVRKGIRVHPFKPQNMANNAAVAADGGEIGRAQALQARAARVPPSVHMNPVLLKPDSETGAQVIVQGRVLGRRTASDYQAAKPDLMPAVLESWRRLSTEADLMLVEGAGSPAEINLRAGDIANMGFALAADVPVVLIGDIDRGGVIASLVGTLAVLPEAERRQIKAYAINRFRGDPRLFDGGLAALRSLTGLDCLGVVPWFAEAHLLPQEDAPAAELLRPAAAGTVKIVVPLCPGISNLDDLDPLRAEPGVAVAAVPPGQILPRDADAIVLPGSKSTISDLEFLRAQGWDIDLLAHVRGGGRVLGICGGMQMLGRGVSDPSGMEGPPRAVEGLGLLDIDTAIGGDKILRQVEGRDLVGGETVRGYEMRLGRSTGPGLARPMLQLGGGPDGARSADGRVMGCYVHGLFAADGFRRSWLARIGRVQAGALDYEAAIEGILDRLADHLEDHLDLDRLWDIAGS
ncbi:MAG: cobyric acid synthase [Alphaproteobacteria bacterium]|nr:cobyric acid synthase [Alphaproteobacteria bacterium]